MKYETVKITCDTCERDISPHTTGYPHNYILKVSCFDIEVPRGAVFACLVYPPIDNDLYFCGLKCMKNYEAIK